MTSATSFDEALETLCGIGSNAEQGARFEELMIRYFTHDPTLKAQYQKVFSWKEWEHNERTHDSGIDLVAQARSGEWTAIQCKFYAPTHSLEKNNIDSFFTASGKSWDGIHFTNRIIISTTDRWSHHAERALEGQQIPVQRIGRDEMAASPIDWIHGDKNLEFSGPETPKHDLRDYQIEAIAAIQAGFETHDRGQWISACGTGKTFTSLRLAETRCAEAGGFLRVLFLAPSIQLVSQTLREWITHAKTTIRPFVVCSDTKASRAAEDITTHDIPLPTTDAARLAKHLAAAPEWHLAAAPEGSQHMEVVFSTYQSIQAVADAAQAAECTFDLVLCDEAHRTTGATLTGEAGSESAFVRVHNNAFLPAAKRLYMTATPRIYGEKAREKEREGSVVLASMDDEATFGPVFHRLGFAEAVKHGLLCDYKVMILHVTGEVASNPLAAISRGEAHEVTLDEAAKMMGCWNALAKHTTDKEMDFGPTPVPMKRAVAFASNIKASKRFAEAFPQITQAAGDTDDDTSVLEISARHVDGTMNALTRSQELRWLKAPVPDGQCRVLSNARCLSEGIDVPALDAVLFLSPRNSQIDVVQSVGRVMRKTKGKQYGYVVLPVAVDSTGSPEKTLNDHKRFKAVWDVLNALRSHDETFDAMINSIELDGTTKGKISIDTYSSSATSPDPRPSADSSSGQAATQPTLPVGPLAGEVLARIVKRVGTAVYWDNWAAQVVDIHANQVARIRSLLRDADTQVAARFGGFVAGLRANLNESISRDDAIDMLSQHLITGPVFDALFPAGAGFVAHNPVARAMADMVDALGGQLAAETASLQGFYESVRERASQVTTPAGRQTLIHKLYEDFFQKAFRKQAQSLGVVYTPVEVVDFIIRSVDEACRDELGFGLTDPGVHVLDPFTGTGTFMVRLLRSGVITTHDLARKYASELWASEIMLLAYYIAVANIETTYQALVNAPTATGDADKQTPPRRMALPSPTLRQAGKNRRSRVGTRRSRGSRSPTRSSIPAAPITLTR